MAAADPDYATLMYVFVALYGQIDLCLLLIQSVLNPYLTAISDLLPCARVFYEFALVRHHGSLAAPMGDAARRHTNTVKARHSSGPSSISYSTACS